MATAVRGTQARLVERVVQELIDEDVILLTLTIEEAKSLYGIQDLVGGLPKTTYRGDSDSIGKALRSAGIVTGNMYTRFTGGIEAKVRV